MALFSIKMSIATIRITKFTKMSNSDDLGGHFCGASLVLAYKDEDFIGCRREAGAISVIHSSFLSMVLLLSADQAPVRSPPPRTSRGASAHPYQIH